MVRDRKLGRHWAGHTVGAVKLLEYFSVSQYVNRGDPVRDRKLGRNWAGHTVGAVHPDTGADSVSSGGLDIWAAIPASAKEFGNGSW